MRLSSSYIILAGLMFSVQSFAECMSADKNSTTRPECLKIARYVQDQPHLKLGADEFRAQLVNPKSPEITITNDANIYCRYVYQKQNGSSAKFRCAQTNEKNELYDTKGTIIPEAVNLIAEDDEVYLADAQNNKLVTKAKSGKDKPIKANILKVRYYKDARNVENYTSAAASRIFWALGIPAHSNYMTKNVVCLGCGKDPFKGQSQALVVNGQLVTTAFPDAAIEVKFDAKRIYSPTQQAWKWAELNQLYVNSSQEVRDEIEILALASHMVGAIGESDMQNAIVCLKFDEKNHDSCTDVLAMAHDLGAAFGKRSFTGGINPRGDFFAYREASIFQPSTCNFEFSDGGRNLPKGISASGKAAFLKRAEVLTKANLELIFSASHMGNMHKGKWLSASAKPKEWAGLVLDRIQEIKSAPCK